MCTENDIEQLKEYFSKTQLSKYFDFKKKLIHVSFRTLRTYHEIRQTFKPDELVVADVIIKNLQMKACNGNVTIAAYIETVISQL